MAVQNSTVERPALNDLSPADVAAQETVTLPADIPARRRLMAQRRL